MTAEREDGGRFIVRAYEKLSAFLELESAIRTAEHPQDCGRHEYKKSHPDVTRQDVINALKSHRTELREGLERFLTPEQLKKWDAEVAKAKEFLGQPTA